MHIDPGAAQPRTFARVCGCLCSSACVRASTHITWLAFFSHSGFKVRTTPRLHKQPRKRRQQPRRCRRRPRRRLRPQAPQGQGHRPWRPQLQPRACLQRSQRSQQRSLKNSPRRSRLWIDAPAAASAWSSCRRCVLWGEVDTRSLLHAPPAARSDEAPSWRRGWCQRASGARARCLSDTTMRRR
jgi:hypothetical protein